MAATGGQRRLKVHQWLTHHALDAEAGLCIVLTASATSQAVPATYFELQGHGTMAPTPPAAASPSMMPKGIHAIATTSSTMAVGTGAALANPSCICCKADVYRHTHRGGGRGQI